MGKNPWINNQKRTSVALTSFCLTAVDDRGRVQGRNRGGGRRRKKQRKNPDHLGREGGRLLGNWLSLYLQSPGAAISHIKQRGNHKVTVQPMVSGAKFNCNISSMNILFLFPYVVAPEGIKAVHIATAP